VHVLILEQQWTFICILNELPEKKLHWTFRCILSELFYENSELAEQTEVDFRDKEKLTYKKMTTQGQSELFGQILLQMV
jgi:hypothetical protein